MASGTFTLRLLGGLTLERSDGPIPPGALQKRRLAVLAILALGGRHGTSRDHIQSLIWPDAEGERARHALDQLLYLTRRDLGRDVVVDDGLALRLNGQRVRSDVSDFEQAVSAGDLERAAELHAGPLLEGVRLRGGTTLEHWLDEQRATWAHRHACLLDRLAVAAERSGDRTAAVEWRRRRASLDPCNGPATLALMQALADAGDPAAAVRQGRVYQSLIRTELGLEPDPAVVALADRLATQRVAPMIPPREGPEGHISVGGRSAEDPSSGSETVVGHVAPLPAAKPPTRGAPSAWNRARSALRPAMFGMALAATGFLFVALPAARARLRVPQETPAHFRSTASPAPGSIAVLPLQELGVAAESSYFSDGLTEELMHALGRVPGLRVVARTSVFALRGAGSDVREIGAMLGVRSVLEGSVRRAGDRVRVNVRLVDAESGFERWSESYERRLVDVLAVQREIADAVTDRLDSVRLSADADVAVGRRSDVGVGTPSYEAFEHFLRGRFHLGQPGVASRTEAVEELRAAVAADPRYARAHAALAEAYIAIAEASSGREEQADLLARAEEVARRAIDLDPHLAEAHASLGDLRMNRWDWSGAAAGFRRAIAANPSLARAHERYGILLALEGRFDVAVTEMHRAAELDPLSAGIQGSTAYVLHLAGRFSEAEVIARRLVSLDPGLEGPHFRLGTVLALAGRNDEAIAELRTAARLPVTGQARALPMLGYALARAGRIDEAVALRSRIERGLADHTLSPYFAAAYFDAVGSTDRAFQVLDDLGRRRESCLRDLAVDPVMAPLRRDPRFDPVLRSVGTEGVTARRATP